MTASKYEMTTMLYRVDRSGIIENVDAAWDAFAEANGAPALTASAVTGHALVDFIADPTTRHLYDALTKRVHETGNAVHFPLRCDGPGVRRFLRMDVLPEPDRGVTFLSTLVRAEPRPPVPLLDPALDRSDELLKMCGWCKRVDWRGGWAEVERYLEESGLMEATFLPRVSHGICPECRADMMLLVDDADAA
jgi:hypothetical protein